MRSSNGGKHELAGWGFEGWGSFRGLSETGAGLRADDGANSLSDAGSSLAAAKLRLAELRSLPEFSSAARFPRLLGEITGRAAVRGHSRAFQAGQARRTARHRWCVPAALDPAG